MGELRRYALAAGGWALLGLGLTALGFAVYEGVAAGGPARWVIAGGGAAVVLLLGLLWRRLSLWSRVHLLYTSLLLLVGTLAVVYADSAAASFSVGPLSLASLVSGVILVALVIAVGVLWRVPRLPRGAKIGATVLASLLAYPYVLGAIRSLSLRDLVQGAGMPFELPLWLQPAVFGPVVFLPILTLFLFGDLVRAVRREGRSALRGVLTLICGLVPVALFALTLLWQQTAGVAVRTFRGHHYQAVDDLGVDMDLALAWTEPPIEGEDAEFWVEWEGELRVPRQGTWEFRLEGGGEGFLYLDGKLVIPSGQRQGSLELAPGAHALRAAAVESAHEGEFRVLWKHPDAEAFTPLDARVLSHRADHLGWRRTPRQAAQVGIDWLQSTAVAWQRSNGCFGCHVQGEALMGLAVAEQHDYDISDDYFAELERFTREQQHEDGHFHTNYFVTATQYGGMALAHVNDWRGGRDDNVERAADFLLEQQRPDGSLPADHHNPPIDENEFTTTSNSVMTFMRAYASSGDERHRQAAERAMDWLAAAEGQMTQDHVLAILALARHGGPGRQAAVDARVTRLRAEQQADGGWKEHPNLGGSNAYATGQVLYAFKQAHVSVSEPAFKRGVLHLLESQKLTGSWSAVNTRSGSKTEFAPTMWAVIGLAGSYGALIPELLDAGPCRLVKGPVPLRARVANLTDSEIASVVFRIDDGAPIEAVPGESANLWQAAWKADFAADGARRIRVVATSASGEKGEDSTILHKGGTFSISLTEPVQGALLSEVVDCAAELRNPAQLPIEAVELRLDDEPLARFEGPPYRAACDFASLPEGGHKITAVAKGCELEAVDEIHVAVGSDTGPGHLQVQLRTATGEQVLYVPPDQIEVVLDFSGSMWGQVDRRPKYEVALEVLRSVFAELPLEARVAVRVYGHRRKGDCEDSELVVAPGPVDPAATFQRLGSLRPVGKTPIDRSLRLALEDLEGVEGRKAVVLLTDGIETCRGDPVEASRALVAAGLGFTVHVVGFDIRGEPEAVAQLREVAEVGGGKFLLAENADDLSDALREAVQVGYSIADANGVVSHTGNLGPETVELMSGSYRVQIDLEPPLVLDDVVIEKSGLTRLELVREAAGFRFERLP